MDDTTQIMTIKLKVPLGNSFENLTIFNVYAPSLHGNTEDIDKSFWMELEDKIARTPESSTPIIGGDINAK
jgi:hypothetical protein